MSKLFFLKELNAVENLPLHDEQGLALMFINYI